MSRVSTNTRDVRPFRKDIQGLRAIAVLLVVIYHAGVPGIPGGYTGVDVFFVISGFLITGHLVSEIADTGRLQFGRFYARRVRRILPASFVVLALTLIASLIFIPPALVAKTVKDAAATALYVPNYSFAVQGTNYLAETAPSPFQHYWSLGVEEQFYLLWPALLFVVWLVVKRRRLKLVVVVGAVVLVSLAYSIILTGQSQPWAFFSLPTRAWEFGIGGLVAIAGTATSSRVPARLGAVLSWVSLAVVILGAVLLNASTPYPGSAAVIPVVGTAGVILFGGNAAPYGPIALLGTRVMQFVGAISYSLYLVHWPLLVIPEEAGGRTAPLPLLVTVGLGILAVPLAWLLYRYVETPVRSGVFFRKLRARTTLITAAATSLGVVAACLIAVVVVDHAPVSSDRVASPHKVASPYPSFTSYVPSNLTPALKSASTDVPILYSDGCHLEAPQTTVQKCAFGDLASKVTVALFGDSHAAQWFPALDKLADEHGFRLDVYTKSSCPSVDVPVVADGSPYTECTAWRSAVIARLKAAPPNLIVMSNLANYPDQPNGGISKAQWAAGLAKTLSALPASSRTFLVSDTPNMMATPSICLSANVNNTGACAVPRSKAVDGAWRRSEADAAEAGGATVIDLNNFICNATLCGPIIGSALLYRDSTHLTASFVTTLAPALWSHIGRAVDKAGGQ
ncbi:MAG TPA: acyltransferase family protein [Galbitalea sp.]|jgi:peptidoglycan/LPS O-acetylase OafA/YrhL|nr:acyltransferase family protein [Galbitalea sp.]